MGAGGAEGGVGSGSKSSVLYLEAQCPKFNPGSLVKGWSEWISVQGAPTFTQRIITLLREEGRGGRKKGSKQGSQLA